MILNSSDDLAKKIEELVSIRKSISLELKSIAKTTNIPTQILKNIERRDFSKLPPHPIGQSYIRQYTYMIEEELNKPKNSKFKLSDR